MNITRPAKVKAYIDGAVATGSAATLFKNPHIATIIFTNGTAAGVAIQSAIDLHTLTPTEGNHKAIFDRAYDGEIWLNDYSDLVETIANEPANRTTQDEAATNILLSYLKHQKLDYAPKGTPETPELKVKNVGTGKVDVEIINWVSYKPSKTTIIMVEVSTGAVISLVVDELMIELTVKGQIVIKTSIGKGRFSHFKGLKPGVKYAVYAFSQNGKTQISELSEPIFVKG